MAVKTGYFYIKDSNGNVHKVVPPDYVGATASTDGVHGLVPGALSADRGKFLRGDGAWATPLDINDITTSVEDRSLSLHSDVYDLVSSDDLTDIVQYISAGYANNEDVKIEVRYTSRDGTHTVTDVTNDENYVVDRSASNSTEYIIVITYASATNSISIFYCYFNVASYTPSYIVFNTVYLAQGEHTYHADGVYNESYSGSGNFIGTEDPPFSDGETWVNVTGDDLALKVSYELTQNSIDISEIKLAFVTGHEQHPTVTLSLSYDDGTTASRDIDLSALAIPTTTITSLS